jgi:hypothetical protein
MSTGHAEKPKNSRFKLIQLIHIGRNKLALSEDAYRELLRGVCGKESCLKMTIPELKRTLAAIKTAGFSIQKKLPLMPGDIGKATPDQLRFIKGMWELVAVSKTDKALNAFILRVAHVNGIRFLGIKEAQKVIVALRVMMVKAGYDPDGKPKEG